MHRILERQIKKYLKEGCSSLPGWKEFVEAVSATYDNFDEDRKLIERSLEISSRELKDAETRFKQVAEDSEAWIWEVDREGLYLYSSLVVEKALGYKPEEIIAKKRFYDFFVPQEREGLKKAVLEFFAGRKTFKNFLNANLHRDGSVVFLETSGSPILNKEGDLLGYRGAHVNVTSRRQAEERQRLLLKDLEDINRIAVGRELRMIELKKEINRLSQELGKAPPYDEESLK